VRAINKVMTKGKALALLTALATSVTAVAGFAPATAAAHTITARYDGPVTDITFWNGHPSGALKLQMHEEVAEFNNTHPNIHVSYIDKYSDVQSIIAAMLGNDAPNVIMPHLDGAQQFAARGYLVNLQPYIDGSDGLSAAQIHADYYPSIWNAMKVTPSEQYIIPYEANGQMVIFDNATLLKKAGITAQPRTWAQVVADAKKVTALGPNYHGIAWTPSLTQFFVMTQDFGGKMWANASRTQFALNNPGALTALTMLRTMVADKSMELTSNYGYQLDFGTGNVGLLIESSAGWTYDRASAGGKFDMVATPAPAGPSGHAFNYVNGDALSIMNTGTTAQQQASWTFIKWLSSPAINAQWNERTNYLPTGPTTLAMMRRFYKENKDYGAAMTNPGDWMTDPAANATQFYAAETGMNDDFDKALLGQEPVARALANMNTVGNEYLDGQLKG